jgi:hypothetical protein
VLTCHQCGKQMEEAALAYNLPGVTPGPLYYCSQCEPPTSAAETMEEIEKFINPAHEGQATGDTSSSSPSS